MSGSFSGCGWKFAEPGRGRSLLGDDLFDDLGRIDAGEFLVEAHEGEGEAVVVDAELVEDGGVEVADADFVFDDVV